MKKLDKAFKKHERLLWKQWFKSKNEENETNIFLLYRPWAENFYRKFVYKGDSKSNDSYYEEFIPDVYIGLLKAIRDFKTNGGATFKTFASVCIRNTVYDALYPFFHDGKQRPGTFNFVGDMLSDENISLRDSRSYNHDFDAKQIIKETVTKIKKAVVGWEYSKKEWKVFYYRFFKFMSLKDIQERVKLSEWKINLTISHIKKDVLDEFGDEFRELLKGKHDK